MINKFWAKDTDWQFMKDLPRDIKCVKNCQSHQISKKKEMRATKIKRRGRGKNRRRTRRSRNPYRIHKIKSTEFKRLNKLKCPSYDASVPLGTEKKTVISGKGRRDLKGKLDGKGGT